MSGPPKDSPGVIIFPPLLFLIVLVVGIGAHLIIPMSVSPRLPLLVLGGLSVLLAGYIVLSARAEMMRAGTNVRPDLPSLAIVTGGPYRFTRNPMYLSLCLLNMGIGLLICDVVPVALTLVLAIVLHFGVIVREEHYLEAKFGDIYFSYRRRVRRWI